MKLGIDFGTCYSSAALLIDGTLHPAKEPLRPLESCFPSSICVTKKGEIVISQAAENLRRLNPQGYKNHFKRDLDTDIPYFLGEQQLRFLPEDLVTVMLRGLKKEAEKIINSSIDSVIVTVPATYLINKKQLMEQAAKKAGFNEVALLEEPVAAAIYYSQKGTMGHQLNEGDILLVYDLGGGTFDAALIQKKGNSYDLLSQPVGDKQCGGIYFDQLIAQDFIKQLHENLVLELLTSHRQDKEAIAAKLNLQDWCRNFKHQLSVLDEHEDLPPLGLDSYSLSRDKFEKMLTPFIDSSCDLCQQLVQQSGIKWESINRVLLVGGSCRIPYVQKRLEQQFNRPVVAIDDPELAICFGAAIYGATLEPIPESIPRHQEVVIISPMGISSELQRYQNAERYYNSGNTFRDQGKLEEAINEYYQAISCNPNHADVHINLANIFYRQGKLEQSIDEYRQAIIINPNDPASHTGLGNALCCQEKLQEAIVECRQAIHLNPNWAIAHNNLGLVLVHQNKLEEAAISFYQAIKLDVNYANAHHNLGDVLLKTNQLEKAITCFRQTIKLNPHHVSAHYNLATILKDKNNIQEAISEYRQVIRLAPDNLDALIDLGNILYQQNKLQEAITLFNQAIYLDSERADLHAILGVALCAQNNLKEGITEFQKAINIEPNNTQFRGLLQQAESDIRKRKKGWFN